jgi:hypothetical protein
MKSIFSHDEDTVHAWETLLIGSFKRLHEGGPLTNLAAGGGSLSGSAPVSKEKVQRCPVCPWITIASAS